jgi:hypothetical protein
MARVPPKGKNRPIIRYSIDNSDRLSSSYRSPAWCRASCPLCVRVFNRKSQAQSTELCLASSKILTPHPLSTQRMCPPPAPKAVGTRSPGGEGVGGWYFGKRQTLDWPLTV